MHREMRRLLPKATGFSEFAIAVTVDIRDFSSFAGNQDATGVAEFVKRFYTAVIDRYFLRPKFYKPTGDGLLILRPYSERTLATTACACVQAALKLVTDFPSLFVADPMLNFPVPQRLGVGLSRGAVCGLISGKRILDYSGRCLNLSARMMDFARPSGVVLDSSFGVELLPATLASQFAEGAVCIKGIAPRMPLGIHYTKEWTVIPPRAGEPIEQTAWAKEHQTRTLRQIKNRAPVFLHTLTAKPSLPVEITMQIRHPCVVGGRKARDGTMYVHTFKGFTYTEFANSHTLRVDYAALVSLLEGMNVRLGWDVDIDIIYPKA